MVVVLLALVALVVVLLLRRRSSPEERERDRELREATKKVKAAKQSRDKVISAAERELERHQREYEARVKKAKKDLAAVEDPRGRKVGAYQGIILYQRWLVTPQGEGSLVGAQATVDTAGGLAVKSRATLTRMAAGGLALGPLGAVLSLGLKKHKDVDTRELYLLVESPAVATVVQCPADEGQKAREFAAKIANMARTAAAHEADKPRLLQQARAKVDHAQGMTAETKKARTEVDRARGDQKMLDVVRAAERERADRRESNVRARRTP